MLKHISGLVHDLRRGEVSRAQEMGRKPDFNQVDGFSLHACE